MRNLRFSRRHRRFSSSDIWRFVEW